MMGMKVWWGLNIVWLFIFSALTIFISIRDIDGSGLVQAPEIKMITLTILGIAFIVVALIQLILLYFVRKSAKSSLTKELYR